MGSAAIDPIVLRFASLEINEVVGFTVTCNDDVGRIVAVKVEFR